MANRVETVVYDIVKAVREVLSRHDVTFEEYRAGVGFLMQYAKAPEYEIPLVCDLWFNATITDNEMKHRKGSTTNVEGPYFLENVPVINDEIKTLDDGSEPLVLEGRVTDLAGKPIKGAEMFVWHSDNHGHYSGFDPELPQDSYRGKKIIGADGEYRIRTRVPAPYPIPHHGPSGKLLEMMGRHPWRPAHVHFKIRAPGFLEHTTQSYFTGGKWVDSDCVEGVRPALIHNLEDANGAKVLRKDFKLDPA
ncbi:MULTISPECIES: dioxygenase [Comamonadaceae]|uniref:dioxygenase family protein n=1 Tax=Comamonadaceae TaxID=80864 RepID=UPI0002B62E4B|nr:MULTISPECIES: dioxygenase [Comamonadaceae]ART89844.1 catechol 1,2-dioxygenase [uncultured bacterium]AGF25473.1 chlorocatechol 1,2-dioxygenase [Variovorax sp. WDL1]ART90405.1 chlorocatechol 2,3-dioxygenase [uncultured bacterium]PNG50560.1 Chlorocatechol 1,2-dioxygenase [Variovorax sp. B2]PNG51429.1 Chlorocatechol 1,2-dioxygenase [Variovorax sp. B4]